MSGEFPFRKVSGIGRPGFFGQNQARSDIQIFSASGTWAKPTPPIGERILGYQVVVIGGGSGGQSGHWQIGQGFGTNGGFSGPAGGYAKANFTAVAFPATVAVTVGLGGTAPPGSASPIGSPPANGGNTIGSNGGNSSFGTFISATGGRALFNGTGPGAGTVTGPNSFNPVTITGGDFASGTTPGGGGQGPRGTLPGALSGAGGGGTLNAGAASNGIASLDANGGLGATLTTPGTDGSKGSGGGGCQGSGTTTLWVAGNGGDAIRPGNGGGGGGSVDVQPAVSGQAVSGGGGAGAPGIVQVVTFFG